MKRKLTIITDGNGNVVATQVGHGDVVDPQSGILGSLVAGPGQHAHKIEFDVPDLRSTAEISDFHKNLGAHLKASMKTR